MGISYSAEIDREAFDFIVEHEDMVVRGLADGSDWDRNKIDGLDSAFHEDVTDRAYTTADATWVIQECQNEEMDSGLWEGAEMEDALQTKAAFSFSNDVWFACEELYDNLRETVDAAVEDVEWDADGLGGVETFLEYQGTKVTLRKVYADNAMNGDVYASHERVYVAEDENGNFVAVAVKLSDESVVWVKLVDGELVAEASVPMTQTTRTVALLACREKGNLSDSEIEEAFRGAAARAAFVEMIARNEITPVEPGSEEERRLVKRWLRMSYEVGRRGGYPLGGSYIDARCGVGYGTPDQIEYVRFDEEMRRRVPHLAGKYSQQVREYFRDTFGGKALESVEEALAQVRGLISDRAPADDFYEMADDIDRVLGPSMKP